MSVDRLTVRLGYAPDIITQVQQAVLHVIGAAQ